MANELVTVEQAADRLKLHPKTVLRYIRDGRLQAVRIGKAYRIDQTKIDAFAGVTSGHASEADNARTTCIVDIPHLEVERADRLATLLNAAALSGDAKTPPLQISTAYDPVARTLKVVVIGCPSDAARLLEMLELQLRVRS